MTTEQTAQQLELAAKILRTGHPWEWQALDGEWVKPTIRTELHHVISDGLAIRLAFATPPDGRQLHNPDNLTAEQVGAGFRLTLKDESPHKNAELWNVFDKKWVNRLSHSAGSEYRKYNTYRLPLSVPWPEPQLDQYADEKKIVPFDISDVPPCSVLSINPPRWFDIYGVCKEGIYVLDDEPLVEILWKWDYLAEKVKINRSIPLTGKWNPDAWEPCHKEIDA